MNREKSSSNLELENLINIIEDLINFLENENLTSYDPYDVQSSFIGKYLQKTKSNPIKNLLRKSALIMEKKYPKIMRINSKKTKSATSSSLFICSCFMSYYLNKDQKLIEKAIKELIWLEENSSKGYSGCCWGLPFNWYLPRNIVADKNTPCSTIVIYMLDAFLLAYKTTKDTSYRDIAFSIGDFVKKDLNEDIIDENTICLSYTPLDKFHVINVNSYVAAILYIIYSYTKDNSLVNYADKLLNYVFKEQNEDGSWYYWGSQERITESIDSLHQCYIIENLYRCYLVNKSPVIYSSIEKALNFYINNFFSEGKITKFCDPKYDRYPLELIDHAEAIIMFSMLDRDFKTIKYATKVIEYTLEKFKIPNKPYFYSYILNGKPVDIPYIRWGISQILYAYAFYTAISKKTIDLKKLLL